MIDKLQYLAKKGILGLDALDNHQDTNKLVEMFPAVQAQMGPPEGVQVAGVFDRETAGQKNAIVSNMFKSTKAKMPAFPEDNVKIDYDKTRELAEKAMRQRLLDQGYTEEEIDSYK